MTQVKAGSGAEGQMTLIEHLTELRQRIIVCSAALFVGALVVWIFYTWIMRELVLDPYCAINRNSSDAFERDCALLLTDPTEGLSVRMTVSGYGGLALAIPVIMWQLWRFIAPGLYAHERKYGAIFVIFSSVLFAFGAGLAYWSVPRALEFLVEIGGDDFVTVYSPRPYVSFLTKMVIGFGVGFQFPIVLIFLQMVDLVQTETLRSGRRFALVGIVVLVAVLTPSGDPFTLLAMSIPMYLFYEVAILFGRWRSRKQRTAKSTA